MKLTGAALITAALAACVFAQSCGVSRQERAIAAIEERFAARDRERIEAEEFRQERFLRRAAAFVERGSVIAEKCNRGEVDVRAAGEVSEAFRRMEKAACWPKRESKKER